MPAGAYLAAQGLAGSDPPTVTPPKKLVPPEATRFDPYALAYVYTADGQVDTDHPVWQKVALALGVRLGALPSSPLIGINLDRVKKATDATARRDCEDAVRGALARLIANRDVEVVSVVPTLPFQGRFTTTIRNLRGPLNEPFPPAVFSNERER